MFRTSTTLLKKASLKNQKPFCRDQPLPYFHRFLILILLGSFLKNLIIYDTVFPCISTEEIMTAKIAEVVNSFKISDRKLSVGEQSTLSI